MRISASGQVEETSQPRKRIAEAININSRDLRVLDSKFLRSRMPVILPREHAIVISLEHVKVRRVSVGVTHAARPRR